MRRIARAVAGGRPGWLRFRAAAQAATGAAARTCGRRPPADAEAPVRRPPPRPRDRSAEVAKTLGVDPGNLVWSPARKTFAAALPEGRLAIHGIDGEPRGEFQTPRAGSVSELRYLGEERVAYLLLPAPSPSRPARPRKPLRQRPSRPGHARKPPVPAGPPPHHLRHPADRHGRRANPVRRAALESRARRRPRQRSGAGDPGQAQVRVDGTQVYPRSGATTVQSAPAWSSDGASLALIEGGEKLRLVVLAARKKKKKKKKKKKEEDARRFVQARVSDMGSRCA